MMLNAFFLKTLLWIPPPHPFNVLRLLMWYLTAPLGVLEYYKSMAVDTGASSRVSPGVWAAMMEMPHCVLCTVAIVLEALLCLEVSTSLRFSARRTTHHSFLHAFFRLPP
jgi:phosphatidylserine synthase 2